MRESIGYECFGIILSVFISGTFIAVPSDLLICIVVAVTVVKMFLLKVAIFFFIVVWSIFPQFQNSRIPPESIRVSTCSIHSGSSAGWWVWFILIFRTKFPLSHSLKTGRAIQYNNTKPFWLHLPSLLLHPRTEIGKYDDQRLWGRWRWEQW